MNKLIRLCFLVFLLFVSTHIFAQIKLGVKAGMNINDIHQNFKDSDDEIATKMRLGYNLGATVDFTLTRALSLQSGLFFTSKGCSTDLEDGLGTGESIDGYVRTEINYLEIPINFVYKISKFQVHAGPYVAVGIGGKVKYDYTYKDDDGYKEIEKYNIKIKPFFGKVGKDDLDSEEGAYSALDYGLNFGVGYQIGPVLVNAGYSLGLGNINPGYEGGSNRKDLKTSNRVIGLSASYYFIK